MSPVVGAVVDAKSFAWPFPLLAKLKIVKLTTSKTQAPDRVLSCRAMYVLTERGWLGHAHAPKNEFGPIVQLRLDDARHARLLSGTVPYCPAPLIIYSGRRTRRNEGKRARERARVRAKKLCRRRFLRHASSARRPRAFTYILQFRPKTHARRFRVPPTTT
jgi:hypothetical protein